MEWLAEDHAGGVQRTVVPPGGQVGVEVRGRALPHQRQLHLVVLRREVPPLPRGADADLASGGIEGERERLVARLKPSTAPSVTAQRPDQPETSEKYSEGHHEADGARSHGGAGDQAQEKFSYRLQVPARPRFDSPTSGKR